MHVYGKWTQGGRWTSVAGSFFFFFQAEDGIRDYKVTGVQTCALPISSEAELERGLAELQRAEARLPHVSRGYFVMRWKSHQLPQVGAEREALVQQLLDAGRIEEFQVRDVEGRLVTAIRSRARDGALREPSGDVALPG